MFAKVFFNHQENTGFAVVRAFALHAAGLMFKSKHDKPKSRDGSSTKRLTTIVRFTNHMCECSLFKYDQTYGYNGMTINITLGWYCHLTGCLMIQPIWYTGTSPLFI